MKAKSDKTERHLTAYYGLLQSAHLIALARAALIYMRGQGLPFPVSPPPQGWSPQTIPFLIGLGGIDALAAGLGVLFAVRYVAAGKMIRDWGLLSLTMAISSAAVFAAGTIPSGVWWKYPWQYFTMALLFLPLLPLYGWLIRWEEPVQYYTK